MLRRFFLVSFLLFFMSAAGFATEPSPSSMPSAPAETTPIPETPSATTPPPPPTKATLMDRAYVTLGAGYGTALSIQNTSRGAGNVDASFGFSVLRYMMLEINYNYYYLTGGGNDNYSTYLVNAIFDYKLRSGIGGFLTFGVGGSTSQGDPFGLALSWEFGMLFPLGKRMELIWAFENITYTSQNKYTNYQMMLKARYYFHKTR